MNLIFQGLIPLRSSASAGDAARECISLIARRLVEDKEPNVRAAAAKALGVFGETAKGAVAVIAVHYLIMALSDESEWVRKEAVDALGNLGPAAHPGYDPDRLPDLGHRPGLSGPQKSAAPVSSLGLSGPGTGGAGQRAGGARAPRFDLFGLNQIPDPFFSDTEFLGDISNAKIFFEIVYHNGSPVLVFLSF